MARALDTLVGVRELDRPEAIIAILRRDDRILVIRRGPQTRRSGYWAPLSGTIEPGESQEMTLVREVREEVGLRARPVAKVWECDTDDGLYLLHWWLADVEPGEMTLEPGEVGEARWIRPEEFLQLEPTFEKDREFFERVLPGL